MTSQIKLFLIISFTFLSGCGIDCHENIISGTYTAQYFGEHDQLIIDRSKKYTHTYYDNGREKKNNGLWNFENKQGEKCAIAFDKFIFRDFTKSLKQPGWWYVEIEKSFSGKLQLCFEPDEGFCFEKID